MNATALAERFGTPLYVYELGEIRDAHKRLVLSLPAGSSLVYSLKANPHPALVRTLAALGCGAEVSSVSELRAALAAGVENRDIIYTGPAKTDIELQYAVAEEIMVSVESARDMKRLSDVAAGASTTADCILRVNPDRDARSTGLTMTGGATQFGIDERWLLGHASALRASRVRIRGLHFYIGSNIVGVDELLRSFVIALETLPGLVSALAIELDVLDLGGGFPHPYASRGVARDLASLSAPLAIELDAALERIPCERRPRIVFESGRYLAGACGTLICRVQDVKSSRGSRFVLLDAGINHLGGMHGLRRLRPLSVDLLPARRPQVNPSAQGTSGRAALVGPLCTPLDSWARDVELPDLIPGDLVMVPNVGAYGLTASLVAFLSRRLPAEVVLDDNEVVDATRLALQRRSVDAEAPRT